MKLTHARTIKAFDHDRVALATSRQIMSCVPRPRQNWVLDPFQDSVFIIVAPLLAMLAVMWMFHYLGAAEATALIIVGHIVMTVAHHLPTFIRIYGDIDLQRRFRWHFILGPVIPILFSICVLIYLSIHDYPVEYFLYLYIMLALWDPWHFLRQHYGFVRIYDRSNAAPKKIAARMDWWFCVAWFVYIMLASAAWLPDILRDLFTSTRIPIALLISGSAIALLTAIAQSAALAMTVVYAAYLAWCWHKHYFISIAKLSLLAITFGVMYLSYTPNAWILSIAPGWTFKIGFASLGIVHMTQYLAIVWRYNRSIGKSKERSRSGIFRAWHAKGGWWLGIAYVVVCLSYGELVTTKHDGRLLMSVLLTVGFASTAMHYYFDGFIWKLRHQQNREALAMSTSEQSVARDTSHAGGIASWWNSARRISALAVVGRQLLYFGVPMTLLTVGAMAAWQASDTDYMGHMYNAQSLGSQGSMSQAEQEARLAYAAMNSQLPFAKKMVELQPTCAREAELAFLTYNQSFYENVVMPQLAGEATGSSQVIAHGARVADAAALLSKAIACDGSIVHPGRENLTREDAQRVLASWQRQIR